MLGSVTSFFLWSSLLTFGYSFGHGVVARRPGDSAPPAQGGPPAGGQTRRSVAGAHPQEHGGGDDGERHAMATDPHEAAAAELRLQAQANRVAADLHAQQASALESEAGGGLRPRGGIVK